MLIFTYLLGSDLSIPASKICATPTSSPSFLDFPSLLLWSILFVFLTNYLVLNLRGKMLSRVYDPMPLIFFKLNTVWAKITIQSQVHWIPFLITTGLMNTDETSTSHSSPHPFTSIPSHLLAHDSVTGVDANNRAPFFMDPIYKRTKKW